jgi:hypothetical protein
VIVLAENNLAFDDPYGILTFQSVPIYFFATAGAVFLADGALSWASGLSAVRVRNVVRSVAAAGICVAAFLTATWSPTAPRYRTLYFTTAATAGALNQLAPRISPNDQVISAYGVGGRFAERRYLTLLHTPGQAIPLIPGRRAVFIVAFGGSQYLPGGCLIAFADAVAALPEVSVLSDSGGIRAYALNVTAPQTVAVPPTCS